MSFNIALSGLTSARADLDVTGNNIANASTAGFKRSRAEFADVFAQNFARVSDSAVGGGSRLADVAQQFEQGNINNTGNALDIAIVGEGFFVVEDGSGVPSFTRDGAFSVDREGFVVNNFGKRLQVYPPSDIVDGSFNTGQLSDLQLSTTVGEPSATSAVNLSANFAADPEEINAFYLANPTDPVANAIDPGNDASYDFTTSLTIFDSLGAPHTATIYARRITIADVEDPANAPNLATANQWQLALFIDGSDTDTAVGPDAAITLPTLEIAFDRNGQLITDAAELTTLGLRDPTTLDFFDQEPDGTPDPFKLANGAEPLAFEFDLTDSTMLGTRFGVNELRQDGFTTGELAGVDISDEGIVQARYTNGRTSSLGKIVLATFNNPQGLSQAGNNEWFDTFESGQPQYGEAGTSGYGNFQAGGLEESNVDLTEELVNLITAQRNFDANSQVIRTENEVTQTAVNLGR